METVGPGEKRHLNRQVQRGTRGSLVHLKHFLTWSHVRWKSCSHASQHANIEIHADDDAQASAAK